ncbi:hypothetical protein BN946_scf184888.g6 [Trametes cinnabarina]|uniref:AB hydrolase-1 domain-containing protein n=1 Tax=Pycnoporus cinnabarinus TaxID=5643 RepID=A0A060SP65_PYCCI|nr:hypothetical protein BN946_scf184888.g6 [Trametes cinnabarina]
MLSSLRIVTAGLLLFCSLLSAVQGFYEPGVPEQARQVPCRGFLLLDKQIECGLFTIPVDWAHLESGRGQIRYVKYPAASNVTRQGTIFLRPGFPYNSKSIVFNEESWFLGIAGQLHARTNGTYDLVLLDVRGQGDVDRTFPGAFTCFSSLVKKHAFYLEASAELGIEPAWDEGLNFLHEQTYEDAQNWLLLQSKMVERCLKEQDTTGLQYIGTSAVVRDLVSLADYFDGPGSPVNFWGAGDAALIGTYLLYMFPERSGRVVLEAPPVHTISDYTHSDSFESWLRAIQHAHGMLLNLAERCLGKDEASCTVMPNAVDLKAKITFWLGLIALARHRLLGWQNTLEVEANMTAHDSTLASVFDPADLGELYPNANVSLSGVLDILQRTMFGNDELGLGVMPIVCGDHATKYSPEAAEKRNAEIANELKDVIHTAPLFAPSIFPPLSSLCHLWPIRAVEPLPDLTNQSSHVPLASPPLVIQHALHPFSSVQSLGDLLPGIESVGSVTQLHADSLSFSVDTCMGRILLDYLMNGTLPTQSVCYGSEDTDTPPSPVPPPQADPSLLSMSHIASLWHKSSSAALLLTAGSGEVLWMLAAATLAFFAALAIKALKKRRMIRDGGAVSSDIQRDVKVAALLRSD